MARDELAPLRAYLQARTTLTLATCSGGRPWACSLFYACDRDCRLYFVSDAGTLHSRHIAENPQVAVTVSGQALDWLDIDGVQLVATAALLEGAQRRRAEQCYLERFPQIAAMRDRPASAQERSIADRLLGGGFYCLTPSWARVIDNRQGFGHKLEIALTPVPAACARS
ncbi:MAG: hypothetical protein CALGDGBN_02184 [Pseudomonadales bacterium]|nr:hypothetical protein [Pseudomonadales bacterium]